MMKPPASRCWLMPVASLLSPQPHSGHLFTTDLSTGTAHTGGLHRRWKATLCNKSVTKCNKYQECLSSQQQDLLYFSRNVLFCFIYVFYQKCAQKQPELIKGQLKP